MAFGDSPELFDPTRLELNGPRARIDHPKVAVGEHDDPTQIWMYAYQLRRSVPTLEIADPVRSVVQVKPYDDTFLADSAPLFRKRDCTNAIRRKTELDSKPDSITCLPSVSAHGGSLVRLTYQG
jgi:hypothetical protein